MSDALRYTLIDDARRKSAEAAVRQCPQGYVVTIAPPKRSLEQNALLWACLSELSKRVPWDGQRLTPEEYKDLLTACLRKQKVVRGIDGGLVFLGARTSKMDKAELSDLIELIMSFAAERGIVLNEIAREYA
jgi:hypothetical protein